MDDEARIRRSLNLIKLFFTKVPILRAWEALKWLKLVYKLGNMSGLRGNGGVPESLIMRR